MIDLQTYLHMLTFRRPYKTEDLFAEEFLAPLGVRKDVATGNWILNIGESDTIFTSHIDTVHRDNAMQKIVYAKDIGIVYKDDKAPLGADDATGMFIMMNMIKAKVEGFYVFHIGEEAGGIGSDDFVIAYEDLLPSYNKVISFDRRGTEDIITHQAGGRCCSDQFARALAELLSCDNYKMKPSDQGLFTDSANYTHLVSECTNVSVGYDFEHSQNEQQDITYLLTLIDKCVKIDWSSLPTVRDPSIEDDMYGWPGMTTKQYQDPDDLLTVHELLALVTLYPEAAANIMFDDRVDIATIEREGILIEELQ